MVAVQSVVASFSAVVVLRTIIIGGQNSTCASPKRELYLVRPVGYKSGEIPITPEGTPTFTVLVDLAIWAITEVSLEKQHMEVDLILSVEWIDNRLTVHPNISSGANWLVIGKEIDDIWSPTLTFRNCKGCSRVSFKSDSKVPVYVHKKDKQLWTEIRTFHRFGCSIKLQFYPMDVQQCRLQVYTGEEDVDTIILKHYMAEGERKINSNITLSEFAPPSIHTGDCSFPLYSEKDYSCLELRVRFERLLGYHITTSYLPTTFIVVLSWISFWLPADAAPARVALGLTSLLTLATRLDQAQRNLPAVSYAKAIDVWMLACIVLVSTSLLEFAISNYMLRRGIGCCETIKKIRWNKQKHPSTTRVKRHIGDCAPSS